jgi:hypothetical protein
LNHAVSIAGKIIQIFSERSKAEKRKSRAGAEIRSTKFEIQNKSKCPKLTTKRPNYLSAILRICSLGFQFCFDLGFWSGIFGAAKTQLKKCGDEPLSASGST